MKTVHSVKELRLLVAEWKRAGERVAFVPTMGNLHEGHVGLVVKANEMADRVVSSIFVNPLQFGEGEDLDSYPRTLPEDQLRLEEVGTDLLFAPAVEEMYPRPQSEQTKVEVPQISDILCGESRPGHFAGVATVVCKLFQMVQSDIAVFGIKDYQQLMVIRRMVEDLAIPVEIVAHPTVREEDGLAMSSRNAYLSDAQRQTAPLLYRVINEAAEQLKRGGVSFGSVEKQAYDALERGGFSVDYFSVRQADDLKLPSPADRRLVILAAAWLGKPRLIDNLVVTLDD